MGPPCWCFSLVHQYGQEKSVNIWNSLWLFALNRISICTEQPYRKEIKTYKLLDDASDTTFVTNKVRSELGVQGVDTSLNLSTMHGRKVIPVTRNDGLIVEHSDRRAQVKLPKVYGRDIIPSRKDQIPTPAVADKWQHLKKIRHKLPPLDENLDVGILIGSNCLKAIKPKEVIAGKSEDPYAVQTLLG